MLSISISSIFKGDSSLSPFSLFLYLEDTINILARSNSKQFALTDDYTSLWCSNLLYAAEKYAAVGLLLNSPIDLMHEKNNSK